MIYRPFGASDILTSLPFPRREPWERGIAHNQAPDGAAELFPNVSLVIRKLMLLQKRDELLLKRNFVMMLILVANVFQHRRHVGLANTESSIAGLPSKGRSVPRFMNP